MTDNIRLREVERNVWAIIEAPERFYRELDSRPGRYPIPYDDVEGRNYRLEEGTHIGDAKAVFESEGYEVVIEPLPKS